MGLWDSDLTPACTLGCIHTFESGLDLEISLLLKRQTVPEDNSELDFTSGALQKPLSSQRTEELGSASDTLVSLVSTASFSCDLPCTVQKHIKERRPREE